MHAVMHELYINDVFFFFKKFRETIANSLLSSRFLLSSRLLLGFDHFSVEMLFFPRICFFQHPDNRYFRHC